ncbi:MAG: matrixin family metalloprotease [Myxococcales bacterium]|nr:matrixin family metalloprotease [Myxococcales bacterium]
MLASVLLLATLSASGPTVGAMGAATMARAREALGREAFVTGSPACPEAAKRCFELAVHVVVEDGAEVQTPAWLSEQVRQANRLFALVDVGFRVGSVAPVDAAFADVQTREQRDVLGRAEHSLGVVHVFVVRRLADVDVPGEVIRGVHWRDRAETSRRWVILSSIASSLVLAHELGHFFGLPHSRYRKSLMNKSPHMDPPWPLRTFVEPEQAIMREHRDRMLADGTLRAVRGRRPPATPRDR